MSLVLEPNEVKTYLELLKGYLDMSMECFNNVLRKIEIYKIDKQLDSESWNQSKSEMYACYRIIAAGMLSAQESFINDMESLKASVGNEYLDENELQMKIMLLKEEYKQCSEHIAQLTAMAEACTLSFGTGIDTGAIDILYDRMERILEKIEILKEKLEFLYTVNDSTAALFATVIDLLHLVSCAIHDGGVTISGEGQYSGVSWQYPLIDLSGRILAAEKLADALENELDITLERFEEIYGEDAIKKMENYLITNIIYNPKEISQAVLIAKTLSALSEGYIVAINGRYKFKKQSNGEIEYCTSEELSELIKNDPKFLENIAKAEVYAKAATSVDPISQESMRANAQYIYDYLRQEGWSKNAICGLLGNFEEESKLNPGCWEEMDVAENGYGLGQWTKAEVFFYETGIADSKTADIMAAQSPQELMDIELQYLVMTCQQDKGVTVRWYPTTKYGGPYKMDYENYISSNNSVEELALVFHASYERSGDNEVQRQERVDAAVRWYKSFTKDDLSAVVKGAFQ